MHAEHRETLVRAYKNLTEDIKKMLAVVEVAKTLGGDIIEKKVPKRQTQAVKIILDKFRYLEKALRKDKNVCPDCGDADHPPIAEATYDIEDFAFNVCEEEFDCNGCWDLGWFHTAPSECWNMKTDVPHIEKCMGCHKYATNQEALLVHNRECRCSLFAVACRTEDAEDEEKSPAPQLALKDGTENMTNQPQKKLTPEEKIKAIEEQYKDVGIRFSGVDELPMIVLPHGMDHDAAIHWLKKNRDELEKVISINHKFPGYYPPDTALALYKAIERTYGFVSQESTPGFWGIIPPQTIGIEESLGKVVQIPWGRMSFHSVSGFMETGVAFVDGHPVMQLAGEIRKGDQDKVNKIVTITKQILREESIYRGKAIQVDFSNFNPRDPRFDPMKAPKFMDLSKVVSEDLILSKDIYEAVDTNLFVPISNTVACRKSGIPLRRGILLAGPFGTGKTLTALITAKLATENKWTYIYITDLKQLPQALLFARNYGPSVVFGEDIDRVLDGERNEEMDAYLNSMDGVDRKHDEVMVVFTTNNIANIHPAMMRPGRIDAIIPIEPPDADAMVRLITKYGRGLIDPNADLAEVGALLAGKNPAIGRELIERSKLRAIRDAKGGDPLIKDVHLTQAAKEMLAHDKFVNPKEKVDEHPLATMGDRIGMRIAEAMVAVREGDENALLNAVDNEDYKKAAAEALRPSNGQSA